MQTPKKHPDDNNDHLTIRFGSTFEAKAGGKLAVTILGLVAVLWVLPQILGKIWT